MPDEDVVGDDALQKALSAAVELREDGDYEESVAALRELVARHPAHDGLAVEYVRSLARAGDYETADATLSDLILSRPDDATLCRMWAELPTQINDFSEVIRRGRVLRETFARDVNAPEWRSLTTELDALYESAQWKELSSCLHRNLGVILNNADVLPAGLVAAGKLFDTEGGLHLVENASTEAWRHLPAEARENLLVQLRTAEECRKLLAGSGHRVVSLGQNCLPYQLLGRWGLVAHRARPDALTPFDLGGFTGNNVSRAVETDFSEFESQQDYVSTPAWGGGQMLTHKPTGVGFFHERGPYWINDRPRFFARLNRTIANWRSVRSQGNTLFVFALCGAGDLDSLASAFAGALSGRNNHLLVVDVRATAAERGDASGFTYVHLPYPRDYDWTSFSHQVSNRGLAFELDLVRLVLSQIQERMRSDSNVIAETSRLITQIGDVPHSAHGSAATSATIPDLGADESAEVSQIAAHADALRRSGDPNAADRTLLEALAKRPASEELMAAWVDLPSHAANWVEYAHRSRTARGSLVGEARERKAEFVGTEMRALYEMGRLADVKSLVDAHIELIARTSSLFLLTADTLGNVFDWERMSLLADLARQAAPPGLSASRLERIRRRVEQAATYQAIRHKTGRTVVSLGQDARSFLIAGRWGMHDTLSSESPSIFDTAGVGMRGLIEALKSDFAGFDNWDGFDLSPAWFGGFMPVHRNTGTYFYAQRQENWGRAERDHFLAGVADAIARWRHLRSTDGKVFFTTRFDQSENLPSGRWEAMYLELRDELLTRASEFVVVDATMSPSAFVDQPHTRVVHVRLPETYQAHSFTNCCGEAVVMCEEEMVRPILHLLRSDARPAQADQYLAGC